MSDSKLKTQNSKPFDVIIIGGGAAGMSAAMWADELGLSSIIIEESGELGGQLLWIYNPIENHLGIKAKDGRELRDVFLKQIENRKFQIKIRAKISDLDLENKQVFLQSGEVFSAKSIIIATGVRRQKLGIEGEEKFQNKGILHSGKRDQTLVQNKKVVIIGGGDAAIENALILSETAAEIVVIHRRKDFRARKEFLEKARNNSKIFFMTETAPTKIFGDETIEKIEVQYLVTKEISTLSADAILLRIGVVPNSEMFSDKILLDKSGYIKIDSLGETNIEKVFAIGDVANPNAPTVSTAVGTGASVVKVIYSKLNK